MAAYGYQRTVVSLSKHRPTNSMGDFKGGTGKTSVSKGNLCRMRISGGSSASVLRGVRRTAVR